MVMAQAKFKIIKATMPATQTVTWGLKFGLGRKGMWHVAG